MTIALARIAAPIAYYVDAAGGSNANPGTRASPKQTLAGLPSLTATPKRRVALRGGQTYRDAMVSPGDGFGLCAWDVGAAPILDGRDLVTGWTVHSGSVWKANLAAAPYGLWLDSTRGTRRSSIATCTAIGNWFHTAGVLYLFSSGGSPGTVWTTVAAVVRRRPFDAGDTVRVDGVVVTGGDLNTPFGSASLWNSAPGGTRSAVTGVAALTPFFTGWYPPSYACAFHVARSTDPLCNVLYLDSYSQVSGGSWLRSGNTGPNETAILAAAVNTFPATANSFSSQHPTSYILPTDHRPTVNPATLPRQIRIPAGAVPPDGNDGHFSVLQPDGTMFDAYGAIRLSTGQVTCSIYSLDGSWRGGDYRMNGQRASMVPSYAGIIRNDEVYEGVIRHALASAISPTILHPSWVLPAGAYDRNHNYTGTLAMGSKLAIPTATNPGSMGLASSVGLMLAQAAKDYGIILVDRGGSGSLSFITETGMTMTGFGGWNFNIESDMKIILGVLQLAT